MDKEKINDGNDGSFPKLSIHSVERRGDFTSVLHSLHERTGNGGLFNRLTSWHYPSPGPLTLPLPSSQSFLLLSAPLWQVAETLFNAY